MVTRKALLRVFKALWEEDELLTVVVAATYAEYTLTQLLRQKVADATALGEKAAGLQLRHLIKLCLALKAMESDMRKPLEDLAELRNDFSHDINYQLMLLRVKAFTAKMPPTMTHDYPNNDYKLELRNNLLHITLELMRCVDGDLDRKAYFDWFITSVWSFANGKGYTPPPEGVQP